LRPTKASSADADHEVIDNIVRVTRSYENGERLTWDINNIPHHSSYLSLAAEKGDGETEPSKRLKWLYEELRIITRGLGLPRAGRVSALNKMPQVGARAGACLTTAADYPFAQLASQREGGQCARSCRSRRRTRARTGSPLSFSNFEI
jgi:hypothetical protein